MRVRLRNYGYYADLLGGPLVELEIPADTLGDLLAAVRSRFGVDLEARRNLRLIVGDRVLHTFPAQLRLEDGVEVAVVPVVAGGSGAKGRGWATRRTGGRVSR
ncbi:MAG: MoaD/ThiS family protein [Firmicutes bacterium]|nr:MoaD/ThiS family protein [Bacillota bacterium]